MKEKFFKVANSIISNLGLMLYALLLVGISLMLLVLLYSTLQVIIPVMLSIISLILLVAIMLVAIIALVVFDFAKCHKFYSIGKYAKENQVSRNEARRKLSDKNF